LVVVAPQELGDFEFDGFLEHELAARRMDSESGAFRVDGLRNCSSRVWLGSWRFMIA
jgi:hypothetical protein